MDDEVSDLDWTVITSSNIEDADAIIKHISRHSAADRTISSEV